MSLLSFLLLIAPPSVNALALCPTTAGVQTIYVKPGTGAGVGTILNPFHTIAAAQNALETDAGIDRVCFSGSLSGTLDLDAALQNTLTLTSYQTGGSLTHGTMVVEATASSSVENLTIQSLDINGHLRLAPADTLTLSDVDVDGGGRFQCSFSGRHYYSQHQRNDFYQYFGRGNLDGRLAAS